MPQTRKISAMLTIRLFMKGELAMIAPVSGLRSGAPGGSSSRPMKASTPIRPYLAYFRPRASSSESPVSPGTV